MAAVIWPAYRYFDLYIYIFEQKYRKRKKRINYPFASPFASTFFCISWLLKRGYLGYLFLFYQLETVWLFRSDLCHVLPENHSSLGIFSFQERSLQTSEMVRWGNQSNTFDTYNSVLSRFWHWVWTLTIWQLSEVMVVAATVQWCTGRTSQASLSHPEWKRKTRIFQTL